MGSEFDNKLSSSIEFIDHESFESAKCKVIEQCMVRLRFDNDLQKLIYKGTGGIEAWWSDLDKTTDLDTINNTKLRNLGHINDLLSTEKNPNGVKRIDTVFRFNMDNYAQIEELQKNGQYLAKQMFKKNETYSTDIKSILYEKDITRIKFSEFNSTHQVLILTSIILNILNTLISTVFSILELNDSLVFLLIPPSVSFFCSICTSLVNHWRLGPVTSELSALMVEQAELIRTLHKYRRMINTRMPLTFVSIEKTGLVFEELRSLSNDMERDILDSFCSVKSAYSKHISLEDRVHLIRKHNGFRYQKKLHKRIGENIDAGMYTQFKYGKYTNRFWHYFKCMFCCGKKFTYYNLTRSLKNMSKGAKTSADTPTGHSETLSKHFTPLDQHYPSVVNETTLNRTPSLDEQAEQNVDPNFKHFDSYDRYVAIHSQMANLKCTDSKINPISIFIQDDKVECSSNDSGAASSKTNGGIVIT